MPQVGVHAILAVATRKSFPRRPWFTLGLVFGAQLPNVATLLTLTAVLVQRIPFSAARPLYERSVTHSVFFVAAVMALVLLVGWLRRWPDAPVFAAGLGVGMFVLHILVDAVAWVDSVGILWPFWTFNPWRRVLLPDLITVFLAASEYFAFAAYFIYLRRLSFRYPGNSKYRVRLLQYMWLQTLFGVVMVFLMFSQPLRVFWMTHSFLFLFIAYPNALWVTWRMRRTITASRHSMHVYSTGKSHLAPPGMETHGQVGAAAAQLPQAFGFEAQSRGLLTDPEKTDQ